MSVEENSADYNEDHTMCSRCGEEKRTSGFQSDSRWGDVCADCHSDLVDEFGDRPTTVSCHHCGAENRTNSTPCRDCGTSPVQHARARGDGQTMSAVSSRGI